MNAYANLRLVKGTRAPMTDRLTVPNGPTDVKLFPERTLDSGSSYQFYIQDDQLLDTDGKLLDRIFHTFATEAGPVVDGNDDDTPVEKESPAGLIIGLVGLAALALVVGAFAYCKRRDYRTSTAQTYQPSARISPSPKEPHFRAFERQQEKLLKEAAAFAEAQAQRAREKTQDDFSYGQHARRVFGKVRSRSFDSEPPRALESHGVEVKRITKKMAKDMIATRKSSLEFRKRDFKFLLLRWHPDKNEDKELATTIFQYIQSQKEWYLEEEEELS